MKSETPEIVWVTKYATTEGVVERQMYRYTRDSEEPKWMSGGGLFLRIGTEVFTDRQEAIKDAETRRAKRIAALRKQIARLEALKFE